MSLDSNIRAFYSEVTNPDRHRDLRIKLAKRLKNAMEPGLQDVDPEQIEWRDLIRIVEQRIKRLKHNIN